MLILIFFTSISFLNGLFNNIFNFVKFYYKIVNVNDLVSIISAYTLSRHHLCMITSRQLRDLVFNDKLFYYQIVCLFMRI